MAGNKILNWQNLSLDNYPMLQPFFAAHNKPLSNVSLLNFFLWQYARQYQFCFIDDCLCLRVIPQADPPYYLYPLGKVTPAALQTLFANRNGQLNFKYLTAAQAQNLQATQTQRLIFNNERKEADYIYAIEDLINLSGSAYHAKKNHINRFNKQYTFCYAKLERHLIPQVKIALDKWYAQRNSPMLSYERAGLLFVLNHFDDLVYRGGVILINDQVAAFTLSEQISHNVAVIHIEKALPEFNGAYQVINQQHLLHTWRHLTWVNREEDLGIAGLRRAKLSYHPKRILNKYHTTLRPCPRRFSQPEIASICRE